MVVKVRFRRGLLVSRQSRKNRRIAALGANFLTMLAISLGALGLWRIAADLDMAGAFFVSDGLLSHWQVWIGAACALQYGSFRLSRYAHSRHHVEEPEPSEVEAAHPAPPAVANI